MISIAAPGSKIWVLGAPGSGKTTLAQKIAVKNNLKHYELDAIFWDCDWKKQQQDIFLQKVQIIAETDGWIIDGQYDIVHSILKQYASTVIWLDMKKSLCMYRILKRTVEDSVTKRLLWGKNRQTLKSGIDLVRYADQTFSCIRNSNQKLTLKLEDTKINVIRVCDRETLSTVIKNV